MTQPLPTFHVVAQPHPLRADFVRLDAPCGTTLAELGAGRFTRTLVDGKVCEDGAYAPSEGQTVAIKAVPRGGGKDPARLAATLALAAYAPAVGASLAGASAGIGFNLATAIVSVAGNLTINALIPPSSQNLDALNGLEPFRGLPSTRNELRPFGVIPRLYGTHRVYPAFGARPYSEQVGSDTYLRLLFCLGYGPLQVDGLPPGVHRSVSEGETPTVPASVRIGDTALNDYEDWSLEWLPGGDADPPLTLFSRNVVETPLADLFDEDGEIVVRTATSAGQITLDFHAPAVVLIGNNSGRQKSVSVALKIEIRPAGSGDPWQEVTPPDAASPGAVAGAVSGTTSSGYSGNWPWVDGGAPGGDTIFGEDAISGGDFDLRAYYLLGSEAKPQTLGVTITPPSSGAWDVRVTRLKVAAITPAPLVGGGIYAVIDPTGSNDFYADFTWTAIRSIGADVAQTVPAGLAFMALRIRVTDQLAGGIDTFSCVAKGLIPVPDGGGGWTMAASSNPAWVFRDILTGKANARPLAAGRVNDSALTEWAAYCDANGCTFDAVFDGRTTVFEAIKNVASTGRATPAIRDGLFSAIVDRADLVPVQMFTDRNSWAFSASKVFSKAPHALRVKFKDRDADWQDSERVVYADGYSEDGSGGTQVATEFEQLVLFGVTSGDRVFRDARYFQAVAQLRPETAHWTADLENLVARRGSVVRRSADAMLLGLGAGRIKSLDATTITLDERLVVEVGKSYQARIRKDDGTQALASVTNAAGTWNTLTLAGGVPAGAKVGDLVAFGEAGLVTQDWLVTGVDPIEGLRARITAVPYSPAVFDAETGPIPPYDPLVTKPRAAPPEPVIINISAGPDAALRANTGARTFRIFVSYAFPASDVPVSGVEAALLRAGETRWEARPGQSNTGLYTYLVTDGTADYRIRLRGFAAGAPIVYGPWAEATVPAVDALLSDLEDIDLQEQRNTPSTPNGDLSTVIVTVTPPTDLTGYSHALIEYRKLTELGWTAAGATDSEHRARVVLAADGESYEFRARAVSEAGIEDITGPVAEITLSDAGNPAPDPDTGAPQTSALNVANLRIAGEAPAETEWAGRDLEMEWDPVAGARDYRVRVFSAGGSPQHLRTTYLVSPRFTYAYAQNSLDSSAAGLNVAQRELRVEVIARNSIGEISETPAEKTVLNPPPELPVDFAVTAFYSAIELGFSKPSDPDFAGVSVHMSQTNGFVPDASNLVYAGDTTVPVVIQNIEGGGTWYLRVVLRDDFGPGTPSLQYTATLQELPWEDDTPPSAVTGLTLRSEVQETDLMVTAALIAEWDASTDNSGKLFYEVEHWIQEDEPTTDTNNSAEEEVYALALYTGTEPTVMAYGDDGAGDAIAGGLFRDATVATTYTVFPAQVGKTYKFRVRALDYSGNASAWSPVVEHTIVGDSVPPAAPTNVSATGGIDKITVRWTNPADSDFLQTRVHRGTAYEFTPSEDNRIATTRADVFVDVAVAADTGYFYKLVALDVSGNPSAASAAAGPAQTVKFSPANIADFMAPGTIDEPQLADGFVQRVDDAEAAISDNVDQINAIQAQLNDILAIDDFNSANTYEIDDLVVHDGAIYRAIADMPTPPAPTPPNASYWEKIGDYASLGEAVAANSAAISALQTDVSNAEGDIAANATAITGLISDVSNLETGQDAQGTAISNLQTTVTSQGDAIAANAAAVDAVEADLSALGGDVTANANAIDVLESTVTQQGDDIEANAANIVRLEADLTAPAFALQGNDGGAFVLAYGDDGAGDAVALGARTATSEVIETLQATVALQGDTLVSQGAAITALESGLADAQVNIAGNASAIDGLTTTVTLQGSQITANAAAITALQTDLGTAEGQITANATAISALETTVSTQGGQITAISASVSTLETQVGDNTAAISTQAASINGIEANWSVRANVNGRVTGIGLIAGGAETEFGILVDRFVIVDPDDDDGFAPFEVSGGNVYIKTAFIRNLDAGQITSGSIATARLTTNVLAALQAVITNLSAIKADIGTITAGTITGVLVRTAASGARVEMSTPNGLRTVNASEVTTAHFKVDGSGFLGVGGGAISWNTAGVVQVPGTLIAGDIIGNTFKTGTSGWRVEIGPSLTGDTVLRYTNGTETRMFLDQLGNLELTGKGTFTGGLIRTAASGARIQMVGTELAPGSSGAFRVYNASEQLTVQFDGAGSGFIGTSSAEQRLAWDTAGNFTITGGLIRTASSGRRVELQGATGRLFAYETSGDLAVSTGATASGALNAIVAFGTSGRRAALFSGSSSTPSVVQVSNDDGNALRALSSGSAEYSIGVHASGPVALLLEWNGVNVGGHMKLTPSGTGAPTHTAGAGTIVSRNNGSGQAVLYIQRTIPSGNTWQLL